jgi:hypothetical protein
LKNFKDHGQDESYQWLDIEYQYYKDTLGDKRWVGDLKKWWWNYGYNKEDVFAHMSFLLFIFTFLTFFAINYLNKFAYRIKIINNKIPPIYASQPFEKRRAIVKRRMKINAKSVNANFAKIFVIITALFGLAWALSIRKYANSVFVKTIELITLAENYQIFFFSSLVGLLLVVLMISAVFKKTEIGERVRNSAERLWYSFIYTANIFFPVFLKVENLKYKNKLATLYVMVVYAAGLICIGYIANFVIQKM